jgi:hypothetical protein
MFLIFGFKSFLRNLAVVTAVCPQCHNPSAHRIVKRTRMFTLFFIPLIPFSIKTYSVCSFCGATTKLDKASTESALAAANAADQERTATAANNWTPTDMHRSSTSNPD